jgi:hypothetical protein
MNRALTGNGTPDFSAVVMQTLRNGPKVEHSHDAVRTLRHVVEPTDEIAAIIQSLAVQELRQDLSL